LSSNFAGLQLRIEHVSLESLKAGPNQTRRHTKRQLKKLARSINDHGFLVPVVIYGNNVIAAGNARVQAAALAGLTEVPVIRASHLSDEQMRLFAMGDNKLTEGGTWDFDALRAEFGDIAISAPQLDQDLSGFCIAERDIIIGRHRTDELTDLDDAPLPDKAPPASRIGDRYLLGRHVLVCGDATDPMVISRAVGDRKVRTVASDLPYNVRISGNVSGLGEHKHGEFAMASGEMSKSQFVAFLVGAVLAAVPHLVDGALLYFFMDWRHLAELLEVSEKTELGYLNLLVWAKTNAGMGSFYRSAHEMIGVFKHGEAPHRNNVELGRHGRNRTNVLHYPGANTFAKGRKKALELHPTVKPVALIADLILDSSGPGELILDPFGGSGTTLIAAEKTDRIAVLVEIDPAYVDVTIRRFEAATGEAAIHEETGLTFAQLVAQRAEGRA
jgi:DNA modification methylase